MSDRRRPLRGRLSILLILCFLGLHHGPPGTTHAAAGVSLAGTALDGDGTPLQDVAVTIHGAEFEQTMTTDKKGRFKVKLPDAKAPYEIRFDRDGLPPHSIPLNFEKSGAQSLEWRLTATPPDASTGSMAALHLFNAGVRAHNDDDFDLALQKYGDAVAEDSEFTQAHSAIANIHHARGDHEQASLAAARVLALAPDDAAALRILYLAELDLGRDGASSKLDRLAELDPTPQTAILLFNEGVAARVAGDRQRALERYTLAVQVDPSAALFHGALAATQLSMKDYDSALASSERALELEPENARGLSVRYNTFIAMGRNEEAQVVLETLQRVAPDAVASAFFERGAALFEDGRGDLAIPALEQAIEADPTLAAGHYTLALCYMNAGRNEEAREHFQTFLELAPDDPDAGAARQLLDVLLLPD